MKYSIILILPIFFLISCHSDEKNKSNSSPIIQPKPISKIIKKNKNAWRLIHAYPDFLVSYNETNHHIIWHDGTEMPYKDSIPNGHKNFEDLLNNSDLDDQMSMPYQKGDSVIIEKNHDPGRIRYSPFFLKMYGSTKEEVKANLVPVTWLPNNGNQILMVSTINEVDKKLQAISNELDTMKHLIPYLINAAGTFNWRKIAGTNRRSMHSFGVTIDINTKYSDYWRWDTQGLKNGVINYKNRIPLEIVRVFEDHGFIWGGKWYHYDTMHFEYRPELLSE